jgi:hypothetical protein
MVLLVSGSKASHHSLSMFVGESAPWRRSLILWLQGKYGGGECWEHSLINRVIPKLNDERIEDPDIRRQILQDIRRYLNEGQAGTEPWQGDAILRPRGLDSDIRVVLEASVIKECFEIAFRPALDAIQVALMDKDNKGTLMLLYGGSTHHEFFRNAIAETAKESAIFTTELVGLHRDPNHSEKFEVGSARHKAKKHCAAPHGHDSTGGVPRLVAGCKGQSPLGSL